MLQTQPSRPSGKSRRSESSPPPFRSADASRVNHHSDEFPLLSTFPVCGSNKKIPPNCSYTRCVRPRRNGLQIESLVFEHLLYRLAFRVISKQRHRPIAVRQKIHRVADPHRIRNRWNSRGAIFPAIDHSTSQCKWEWFARHDIASTPPATGCSARTPSACHPANKILQTLATSAALRPLRPPPARYKTGEVRVRFPRGNETALAFHPASSLAAPSCAGCHVSRFGVPPSTGITYTSTLPSYCPVKAIHWPSGENTG